MVFDEVFEPFIDESPVSVMFRGTLEAVFSSERLDQLFENVAERQYCGELAFSTCAELLSLVVTRIQPSVHAAYRKKRDDINVSVRSIYNKLSGIESAVSEHLVRETAADLKSIVEETGAVLPGPLAGYDVRIADGNHLSGTQHRLKELRAIGDAPLPGHTVAVLNPHVELVEDLIVCRDGYASQKPIYIRLLDQVRRGQCWIADRDYSTLNFLGGIAQRKAYFVIRQHGSLKGQPVGRRRRVGRIDTGVVYEQDLRLTTTEGEELTVRRVTLKLDEPTRDGDAELHLLTNLPKKVSASKIAVAYASRWQIETAFAKLTTVLKCELNTLGYPEAALFGFCLAVVMYNAMSVVLAALRAKHPEVAASSTGTGTAKKATTFSFYYLADEISGVARGMAIAIPTAHWTSAFANLTPKQLAKKLLWLASRVNVDEFLANPYGPQQRTKKKRKMTTRGRNVSTYRILQKRAGKTVHR
ncbi:MAG: transposase [Planctomycetota bacterium]|nr:transposase [Planctomycetota bacterium]